MSVSRRHFLQGAGATLFSAVAARRAATLAVDEKQVQVLTNVAIGTIRPELHGHFAEHLGACTYGGLWIGPNSPIPNISGYRKQAVEYLRALGIPVLRWPGGCFADDYHWRDGIGPVSKRPKTVNIHWGNYTEDNSFGTHEFLGLCKLLGAEPYLAGNVGSGTPQELRDWVEYCNYPSGSSLSDERARNGSPEPFRVRHWGVGNENWGCGGEMRPEEYATQYRRFATFIRPFGETRPFLIACGPNGNNTDWTRRFFDNWQGRRMPDGFAMHFYSSGRSPATSFTVENMQEQLSSFARIERAVMQQRALLDSYDPERRIGLMVDEWGVWDRILPEDEKKHGKLCMPITMRSAIAAALGLNVFHRQAEKLYMCNIAQIVNVLHSMLLTEGDRCIRTTSYYAFELLKEHRGRTALRVEQADSGPLGLSVSASRKDRDVTLTLVNPKHDTGMRVSCEIAGASNLTAQARILHHPDYNAANTLESPDVIMPREHSVTAKGSQLNVEMRPFSIVTVSIRL